MSLLQSVFNYCQNHKLVEPHDRIVVGVSGGADSVCLLALLKDMAAEQRLTQHIAHLNHNLRGDEARDDALFVANLASQWHLPVSIGQINVANLAQTEGLSLEEAGRKARYRFLVETARQQKANKIAVAHNANDQAETVLMRFLRGAGVTGLRGMLPKSRPAVAEYKAEKNNLPWLIRPLLNTPRAEIEAYCQSAGIVPRQDASNKDPAFLRNRLRLELLPLLESYNPNIYHALQKMAGLMTADYEVLQNEAERAWRFVVTNTAPQAITIDLSDWLSLPLALQRQILRRAIKTLRPSLRNIDFIHIEQSIALLTESHTGAKLNLPQNLEIKRGYNTFTVSNKAYQPPLPDLPYLNDNNPINLTIPGITRLPDTPWYIHSNLFIRSSLPDKVIASRTPWQAWFNAEIVGSPFLRTRQPGDIFYPYNLKGHQQSLKKYMINQKIPVQQRNIIPLLNSEKGEICWVCGHQIDHRYRVTTHTRRVLSVEFKRDS